MVESGVFTSFRKPVGYNTAAVLFASALLAIGCGESSSVKGDRLSTPNPAATVPAETTPAQNPAEQIVEPKASTQETVVTPDPNKRQTIIAIDPGHGPNATNVDPETGFKQVESHNQPETQQVWSVSLRVKNSLIADGYKVVMLKRSEEEKVTFRQRADRAKWADADLAVSIHGDPGLPDTGQLYPQKVGLWRGRDSKKTFFEEAPTARLSQIYTRIIQGERQKIEGKDIVIKTNNFAGRAPLEPGTIPMVQLFGDGTPWVYSEKRMPFSNNEYSLALVNGIQAALPPRQPEM